MLILTDDTRTAEILASHGIGTPDMGEDTATDTARDHGVLYACHGCGCIGVAPAGLSTEDYYAAAGNEAQQRYARERVADISECCGERFSVVF